MGFLEVKRSSPIWSNLDTSPPKNLRHRGAMHGPALCQRYRRRAALVFGDKLCGAISAEMGLSLANYCISTGLTFSI